MHPFKFYQLNMQVHEKLLPTIHISRYNTHHNLYLVKQVCLHSYP